MDQLSGVAIAAALSTRRLGRSVRCFPTIGSTNDAAHAEAAAGAADGLLVVADEQTAGRGRHNRRWWAPAGSSLLFSLLLRPMLPAHAAGQLPMCLGLAAFEGITAVTGLRPALKWPNDLLLGDRKLGGMLTELRLDGERIVYAVLGLGVNVNVDFDDSRWAIEDAPGSIGNGPWLDLASSATSLSMALGRAVDRIALLAAILARCEARYDRALAGESPHADWAARLGTLGQQVTVTTAAGVLTGVAAGVTPEGALIVRDPAGGEHILWSGDVAAVRPI